MKIVLIKPDVPKNAPIGKLPPYLPIGIAFLAGVLEKEGFDVVIIDNYLMELSQNSLAKEIQFIKPDIVGVSCNIATTSNVANIVSICNEEGIPVVVGGPQVTIEPKKYLKKVGCKIGVLGEGELSFLEICRLLFIKGKLESQDLKEINGLMIKLDNGEFYITGRRNPIMNLDTLPFLPLHLFPYMKYTKSTPEIKATPLEILFTSRGCPFQCNFCSNDIVWGRKFRCMSAKRIINEIEFMIEQYGTKAIYFQEDNFTVNKERIKEFSNLLIKRNIDIKWMCESRVDTVSDSILELMRNSGCVAIFFGVESGSQRILNFLEKGITINQIENAFSLCRKFGIKTGASIMLGVPTQKKQEEKETIRLVKKIKPEFAYFNPFVGYPGSKMYEYIINNNLVYTKWEDIVFPNSAELTWPQKVKLKERFEISFNIRPNVLLAHIKRMGFKRMVKKSINTLKRYITVRRSIKREVNRIKV